MIQGKFEAKKDGLRQTQDGQWKLTFTVHPEEFPAEMAQAPMGTRYMVGYAEIGDDDQPVATEKPEKTEGERAVQRAGILANDMQFLQWAARQANKPDMILRSPDDAAAFIRIQCDVQSRAEFKTNPDALKKFLALETSYKQSIGQVAQPR